MGLLIKMLSRQRLLALCALCASALAAAVALWWNAQLSVIIDMVSSGGAPSGRMVGKALATMLLMGAAAFLKGGASGYAGERMTHDLRMGYARHLSRLPVAQAEQLSAGEQLSKLQNEITSVCGYVSGNFFGLFDDGVQFLAAFVWLLLLSPALTLASTLPALAVVGYVLWSSRIISLATAASLKAKGEMNRSADTLLTLFPVIRLYDAARMTRRVYGAAVRDWEVQTVAAERTKARLMSLSALLSRIPLFMLFFVGGRMAIGGALTMGTLYVFLNLSGNVSGVLMNMPGHIAAFRQFSANMKRLAPQVALDEKERAA